MVGDKPPKNKGKSSSFRGSDVIDQYDPLFLHSNDTGGPTKINMPNLVCTYYNMNGHTADRCFELVGYPPKFKKNTCTNRGPSSNNVISRNKDRSVASSNSFTDDHYKRLIALISEKSDFSSMPVNIAVNPMIMGDSRSGVGKSTNQLSHVGTENTGDAARDAVGHPDDSTSAKMDCDNLEGAIPKEKYSEYDGDNTFYQEFNDQFQSLVLNPDNQTVSYSKLSVENFNFSTSINKISEPKSYTKAASDIRWVEAMNQEMEALNRNCTWIITDFPVGRKPIAKNSWPIFQMYINNSFLYGELIKDVYIPEGYFDKADNRCTHAPLPFHLKITFRVLRAKCKATRKSVDPSH
uniref:Putative reverse transcriptase, RNA-dependent DNA polymerase, Gag-polypeptide of LTR copia-type n=1 Tax=Tanacetum cinerariifolium TaxID=118510 RepID=A0A6L2K4X0_TANCI|nr:putative reverse transcriptase, RNA-dependent DNA polymerase, Gag-polypeptide of LTR copia-type [Tanacetum cinerariifolium]